MSETDLKETLCAQQELLQKLYEELEAEREASASAVSEALAVILRLEGEKAAVRMEADQYKRLSEEKICHAEESLSIVEDVMYQKEMEISALDHQVQAYRYKLLSMGYNDLDIDNGNLLNTVEETSAKSIGRRNSAPVSKKAIDLVSREKTGQEMFDSGKKTGNSSPDSYWEQMRKLDDRVKEITGGNSDLYSRNVDCSSSVHDVFEVPNVDESSSSCESEDVHPQAEKMEKDWAKKVLQIECNLVVVEPRVSTSCVYDELGRTSEIVEEIEKPSECCNRSEEVNLLNEIKVKLDLLHQEIRDLKVKKKKSEEPCLSILSEAMLSFWL